VTGATLAAIGPTVSVARETPIENGRTDPTGTVTSPDGRLVVRYDANDGTVTYELRHDGATLVEESRLGMTFADGTGFDAGLSVTGVERTSRDTTWQPVWGAESSIRDAHEEVAIGLATAEDTKLTVVIRAYDDGMAFRYVVPEQAGVGEFTITDERSEFAFADDYTAWWIPDDYDRYEYEFRETALSEVMTDVVRKDGRSVSLPRTATPLTMRAEDVVEGDDRYLSVHEAALTDYAGMTLARASDLATFESVLVPYPDGTTKVVATAPHPSPWRTIQVGERPGELIESRLIATLNDPLADVFDSANQGTDWVDPGKYCGVWWEMHKQVASWNPGPDVGATTENIKSYIDFAARAGIPYVFAEGWNVGWDDHPTMDFDRATQYVDYQAVLDYCAQNEVEYLAHNETFGWVANYQSQLEAGLFAGYAADGVRGMKTGYVSGPIHEVETPDGTVESGHHHHGQLMVNHYRAVTRRAAQNRLFVNVHEPIKPTGVRRTYPNAFSREGIRGMEQNATANPNEPNDTCIYPFTRALAGPVDYNAAIFAVDWAPDGTRLKSTRARQLAFLVVWLSGVQMVTDLPRHYTDDDGDFYEEFQFVRDVPVDWDETRVLAGGIGTHLAIARRSGDAWYVGSITDDTDRAVELSLEFLDPDRTYVARLYGDAPGTDRLSTPREVAVDAVLVDAEDTLVASMGAGGGQAVSLTPASASDRAGLPAYEDARAVPESLTAPEEVAVGDPVATLTARNRGNVPGGGEFTLFADGTALGTDSFRVAPGGTAREELSVGIDEPGTYAVTVGRTSDRTLPSETVRVVDPYARSPADLETVATNPDARFGVAGGDYYVTAAGADVEFDVDEYGAVYLPDGLSTGGAATVTVARQDATHPFAKAGLVVRNDAAAAGVAGGYLVASVTPENGFIAQWDADGDGYAESSVGPGPVGQTAYPADLRIQRSGDTFTVASSVDGRSSWTTLATATLPDADPTVDVGMVVTSHDADRPGEARFSDFAVEGVGPVAGERAPTDPDGDGRFEDVDGDGAATYDDVVDLFEGFDDEAVRSHPDAFDFNGNGRLDHADLVDLFESIR
jgi:alpha-glucosidase